MNIAKDFSISAKSTTFISVLIMALTLKSAIFIYSLFAISLAYTFIQCKFKLGFKFLLAYFVICFLWLIMTRYDIQTIVITSFHIYFFWTMMPVFVVSYDLILSPPGQISAFLSKHKMHSNIILASLVVFRFFPTIKAEFKAIYQSMHNRGLLCLKQIVVHPIDSFEYILVPLLMRIIQISDQLTISALSRGIEYPTVRTAYYNKITGIRDYICMGFFALLTIFVIVTEVIL